MNKFKDFIYDKNDMIVALVIILLAAAIIYFRIGNIMHYPETLAKTNSPEPAPALATTIAETQSTSETTTSATKSSNTTAKEITIPSNATSQSVAKKLEKEGFISSALDFEDTLEEFSLTGYIQSGTFEIPAGSTTEQIIEIITKRKIT